MENPFSRKNVNYFHSYNNFYKDYDINGPSLILIKTTTNMIFGGFTPLNWNINEEEIVDYDNQTFLFSLYSMKKFDLCENSIAIICKPNMGPIFGNSELYLSSDLKQGEAFNSEDSSFDSFNCFEFLGKIGNRVKFNVQEIEIIRVLY